MWARPAATVMCFVRRAGQQGPLGSVGFMENQQGLKLRTFTWPAVVQCEDSQSERCLRPVDHKGSILIIHGHSSHLTYVRLARCLVFSSSFSFCSFGAEREALLGRTHEQDFAKYVYPGKPRSYFGSWIHQFNMIGFAVAGMDLQSMGGSEGRHGLRSYVESFDHFVNDILQFVSQNKGPGEVGDERTNGPSASPPFVHSFSYIYIAYVCADL